MPQLIVRQVEVAVVKKLKAQAGRHGVSMEAEHRRILRQTLLGRTVARPPLKVYLRQMPGVEPDDLFERNPDLGRRVDL